MGFLLVIVFVGFLVLLALDADDGGKYPDASLPLHHLPAKLVPCVESSNAGCGRPLPRDLHNVPEAVVVESAHRVEVGGKRIGVLSL